MTATYGVDTYGTTYTTPITGDQAGLTHNIVMDNVGLMTAGTPTRSDITSAIPRISIGSEQRQHTDFSERDTFGQKAYHHGFGELNRRCMDFSSRPSNTCSVLDCS